MFKKILVAIDGSPPPLNALTVAAELAFAYHTWRKETQTTPSVRPSA